MESIIIGCDSAAVDLKYEIINYLKTLNISYEDVGVHSREDQTMYPIIAQRVATKIQENNYASDGILICGTGIGMAIAVNKFKGIYAAVCHDTYSAERAKKSNNTNVITMGARVIGSELAKKVLNEWLTSKHTLSLSTSKVNVIKEFENENFK